MTRTSLLSVLVLSVASACAANSAEPPTTTGTGGADGTGGSPTGPGGSGGTPKDAGPDSTVPPDATVDCTDEKACTYLNDQCTVGSCINGLCQKTPFNDFGACDDGKFCTDNDACQNGICIGGTTKYCPSMDSCHIGLCDEGTKSCTTVAGNDGASCEDNDPCTYAGVCNGGVCTKGQQIDCTIYDSQCTLGVCDPAIGCQAQPSNQNGSCDDGQYCTINDHCNAGVCVGSPNTCAPPGDVCMIGTCDEATDTCIAVPGNDGASCNDGNFCTSGETCAGGQCLGGAPANNGVMCDDGNGCTFGTTCAGGMCGSPTSQILQCIDNDQCCPAGCPVDTDCLYWASGVQQNVPESSLTGWSQCWAGTYDGFQPTMQQILAQCDKAKLLMACRPVGSPNYTLLAMGPRLDVLFDCGQQVNCTKQSNGVGFYYSDSYSWGFAPGGQSVNRNSCDYNDGTQLVPNLRMCWHTGGGSINAGYRCGDNDLNGDPSWQRVVYEAD